MTEVQNWVHKRTSARAMQFTGFPGEHPDGNGFELLEWIHANGGNARQDGSNVTIRRLFGDFTVRLGDYAVLGYDREFHVVREHMARDLYDGVQS